MARLEFQDIEFIEEKERKDRLKLVFYRIYHAYIQLDDLAEIKLSKVEPHALEFDVSEKKAQNKFYALLARAFEGLVCSITGKRTVYVHRNSGIPLVGEGVFGLIDRNTNCIEVKPLTVCNLDCIYCSVDAGPSSRKKCDYIVEESYIVDEFNKLAGRKENPVEAHIGPQGEPLLYAPMLDLIRDLRKNPKVKVISIDTNGTLLTRKLIDDLAEAGLTRLNVSLQATDEALASKMAGMPYKTKYVMEMIEYASKKLNVLIAPVILPTINDGEIEKIIALGKKIKSDYPTLGIQNFLNYKRGRNPVKQKSWDEFFSQLKAFENSENIKLRLHKDDFGIIEDTKLEKPFKKRDIVKAVVVCDGPEQDERIAAANDRAIIVDDAGHLAIGSSVKVEIVRDKHNIFRGVARK